MILTYPPNPLSLYQEKGELGVGVSEGVLRSIIVSPFTYYWGRGPGGWVNQKGNVT